jgi:hypothetical protein
MSFPFEFDFAIGTNLFRCMIHILLMQAPRFDSKVLGALFLQHDLLNGLCGFCKNSSRSWFSCCSPEGLTLLLRICSGVVSLLCGGRWIVNFLLRDNEGRRFTIDLQLMHDDGLFPMVAV